MPLIKGKSKKAFSHNVASEMDAGKPQDQSLAIAYNMKRKNSKKMAYGGMAENDAEPSMPQAKPDNMRPAEDEYMADHFAKGGMADADEHYSSIADAILAKKKKAKMMADGGMVDIEENGEEEGSSPYDDMNADAAMKELYDDEQLRAQPEDSNEKGDDISSDSHDMVDAIRKKYRAKKGM